MRSACRRYALCHSDLRHKTFLTERKRIADFYSTHKMFPWNIKYNQLPKKDLTVDGYGVLTDREMTHCENLEPSINLPVVVLTYRERCTATTFKLFSPKVNASIIQWEYLLLLRCLVLLLVHHTNHVQLQQYPFYTFD